MSWHYLRARAAVSWAGNCSAGAPVALLRLIPMRGGYYWQDNATACYRGFQFGMTYKPSTVYRGGVRSTLSAAVSHAKISAWRGGAVGSTAPDLDYGDQWHGSFAKYCRVTCSWKTHQCLLVGGLASYSAIWPRWGIMRGGACWALDTLERRTNAIGFGCWLPTPTASNATSNKSEGPNAALRLTLRAMARQNKWPTPSATDYKGSSKPGQRRGQLTDPAMGVIPAGGQLNPPWVAWLMGWPVGWTDLKPLAMDKYQAWRRSHGTP